MGSARIKSARQRLADIFDVIEGGSVERIKRQPNLYLKNGVRMSPKRFLDLASSSGLEETSKRLDPKRWEHNRGVFSDLGDEYTGDPSVQHTTPTTGAMWHEGEQYMMPKKFYIIKDKEGNYTDDMHKYIDEKISDDGYYMEGVDEIDFIDEDTPPTTYEGKPMEPWKAYHGLPQEGDTRNKILGTGEDLVGDYATHPGHEIFRGDETGGTVEYFRRLLRRGEGFERPQFSVDDAGNITSHEGRHRARAMFDEDVKDFPVGGDIAGRGQSRKKIPLSKIKGEGGSIDRKRADLKVNEALTGNKITIPRKDTRYPILGRYSKSVRIQTARQRLADIFDVIEGGGKIKPTKFVTSGWAKERGTDIKTTPESFLDLSSGGWKITDDNSIPWNNWNAEKSVQTKSKMDRVNINKAYDLDIFRGDERGTVEHLRRKLRRGDPVETPFLDVEGSTVKDHEGRHRSIHYILIQRAIQNQQHFQYLVKKEII